MSGVGGAGGLGGASGSSGGTPSAASVDALIAGLEAKIEAARSEDERIAAYLELDAFLRGDR